MSITQVQTQLFGGLTAASVKMGIDKPVEKPAEKTVENSDEKKELVETKKSQASAVAFVPGGLRFATIPVFDDMLKKRKWMLEHMAGAFRVFARKGYCEASSGHISVRDPIDPNTFWINPHGYHFGMLKASDMVHVDEEGNVIGGNIAAVNVAGFRIHSAIHKARPDVNAACHAHSVYGKAWSTFGRPIDIINQDACLFWNMHTVYRSFGGMVLEADEADNIAEALGPTARAVILQNHGLITVGNTVDEAAAYYTLFERACQIQLLVEAAGIEKVIVSDKEAEYTQQTGLLPDELYTDFQPDFNYEVWKSKGEVLQ